MGAGSGRIPPIAPCPTASRREVGPYRTGCSSRRPSNRPRTTALPAQQVEGVRRVAGHVAVADQHAHVGGHALGAQRRRGEAGGHREEDDGAALGGGQDGRLLAAGHVDADDGDVGRPAGGRDGLGQARAGCGRRRRRPRRPGRWPRSRSRLALDRHHADAAAGTGVARRRRATASRTCRPRRARPRSGRRPRRATYSRTTRATRAGAPQTSMTIRARSGRGRRAAARRWSGRTGSRGPAAGTRSERPSQRARPSVMTSGVSDSETSVATRSPTDEARAATRGPTSSTVPMSMPPGAGDRVLHLAAGGDDVEHLGAHAPSAVAARASRRAGGRRRRRG